MIPRITLAVTIVCWLAGLPALADEPTQEQRTLRILQQKQRPAGTLPDGSLLGTRAWLSEYSAKNGDPYDGLAPVVEYTYLYRELFKDWKGPRKGAKATAYPPVLRGELMPVLGYIYRSNTPAGGELIWVPDKDLPAGLSPPDRSSLFVPLQRKGVGRLIFGIGGASLICTKITPGKGGNDAKDGPTAELSYGFPSMKNFTPPGTVRAGDIVVLLDDWGGYVVRRIIPPDEKGKVIGWVELSAAGMSEDEIKKATNTVVRLEPAKK